MDGCSLCDLAAGTCTKPTGEMRRSARQVVINTATVARWKDAVQQAMLSATPQMNEQSQIWGDHARFFIS